MSRKLVFLGSNNSYDFSWKDLELLGWFRERGEVQTSFWLTSMPFISHHTLQLAIQCQKLGRLVINEHDDFFEEFIQTVWTLSVAADALALDIDF